MRILHFSDIHIGIESYGRPLTEEDLPTLPDHFAPGESGESYLGYSTRVVDFLCAFDELAAYALHNDVDLVLFSGDAYKNREPTQTHQREFAKRVARLAGQGVPVFLLVGNHDLPHAPFKASAVEIFHTLDVANVTVGDRLDVYRVQTRKGPLQVLALPWIRRSAFLMRDEVRNLPFNEANRLLEQKLTDGLADQSQTLDPAIPAVLSGHVSVNTAKPGTECTMMVGYDHVLMQSALTQLPVDYIALGHIHRKQQLSQSPPMAYSGSLQRVDFGEEDHEDKGFWLLDLDPEGPLGSRVKALEFHPVAARSFVTIEATVAEDDPDPTATVLRAIGRHHVAGAVVRVQVKLPASQAAALRDRDIRQALQDLKAHTVTQVARLVERSQRTRLGAIRPETKSPQEMLRLYLDTRQVSPERARKLVVYAERLMREQDGEQEEG